jgi:hypothetical protein
VCLVGRDCPIPIPSSCGVTFEASSHIHSVPKGAVSDPHSCQKESELSIGSSRNFTEMCSGSDAGSYLCLNSRLESNTEEEE